MGKVWEQDFVSHTHHNLRSPSRREITIHLMTTDETTAKQLSRVLTANRLGIPTKAATGEEYRKTYNSLTQTHLPRMDKANIVDYDKDRKTVTRGPDYPVAFAILLYSHALHELLR